MYTSELAKTPRDKILLDNCGKELLLAIIEFIHE
jgi:hypothetical protein